MLTLKIDASGLVQALNVMGANLGDMTPPVERVLTSGLMDAAENVESGGSIFGDWAGYSEFTATVDKALGRERSGTMLREHGGLLGSLEPGGPGNILEAGPEGGQAGTEYPVAVFQGAGTDRVFKVLQSRGYKEPGIPARQVLAWREDRLPEYDRIFADHIFEGVAAEA